jgi:hypothetical protein
MAVIALQRRLVYRIGRIYGHEADAERISALLASAGWYLPDRYLGDVGRKLGGGFLQRMLSRQVDAPAQDSNDAATPFVDTFALGHACKRYYAGAPAGDHGAMDEMDDDLRHEARRLVRRYLPHMQRQAASVDTWRIVQVVRDA